MGRGVERRFRLAGDEQEILAAGIFVLTHIITGDRDPGIVLGKATGCSDFF
jgi:hypothetical protein